MKMHHAPWLGFDSYLKLRQYHLQQMYYHKQLRNDQKKKIKKTLSKASLITCLNCLISSQKHLKEQPAMFDVH